MTSSLSAQLQKLQENRPSTTSSILNPKTLKSLHSVSLLFPPQHAATQDFDTIFSICYDGYQELCSLEPKFTIYSRSLFSEQSKSVDRETFSKVDNQNLDDNIKSFLGLLGGWALVKSGVKALEWLVRRFRVHYHNANLLLLTFLPYHQHPFFLRLISILPQPLPNDFAFLAPYRKVIGTPIPKSLVVQTLSTRTTFFTLVANHVIDTLKANHGHPTLIRFWGGISLESIGAMIDRSTTSGRTGVTEEDIVTQTLPIISDSLDAGQKSPEFQIGAYMLLALLASRIVLEDKVIQAAMETITSTWLPETVVPAIACLSLLAQRRDGVVPGVSSKITKRFLDVTSIGERLLELSAKYRADKLIAGICENIVRGGEKTAEAGEFVLLMLGRAPLVDKQKKKIIKSMIDIVSRQVNVSSNVLTIMEDLRGKPLLEEVIKETGCDVDLLEVRLGMVMIGGIDSARIPENMNVDDLIQVVIEPPTKTQIFEQRLALIPDDITEQSFMTSDAKNYAFVGQSFLAATSNPEEYLPKLYEQPLFKRHADLQPSLFIKTWTGPFPLVAREFALVECQRYFKEHEKVDFQAILPHLLAACSDQSRNVRKLAISCLNTLHGSYNALDKKLRKKDAPQVWGFDTVYGTETEMVKWLSYDETKKVLDALVGSGLEECVLDQDYVFGLVDRAIGGLKKSLREAFLTYFSSHISSVPGLKVKSQLLAMINTVPGSFRTKTLLPLLEWWSKLSASKRKDLAAADKIDLQLFEERLFKVVGADDRGDGIKSILDILAKNDQMAPLAGERLKTLWAGGLRDEIKPLLAKELLTLALDENGNGEALEVLRDVPITSEIYEDFLVTALSDSKPDQTHKRQKTVRMAEQANQIKKATIVLELLEGDNPAQHPDLLGVMFLVLGKFLEMNDGKGGGDYIIQIVLSCLSGIVSGFKNQSGKVDSKSVRADMLVSCIRSTSSPQVQNSALLLVASLADISPEVVLHSVMPIFTFMGANTLRQDDEYSAHVIEQTIQRVIPPLVASLQVQGVSPLIGSAELLSSFVAAFQHIPAHRRLKLFMALTKTLGPSDFLYALLAMLGKKYHDEKGEAAASIKEFCVVFCGGFSAKEQLQAIGKYLEVVLDLKSPSKVSESLFELRSTIADELKTLSSSLLEILRAILTGKKLHGLVLRGFRDDAEAKSLKDLLSTAIERAIQLDSDHDGSILQAILNLLPISEFVDVIESLLTNSEFTFQSNVLRSLRSRMSLESKTNKEARASLVRILPTIASLTDRPDCKGDAIMCLDSVIVRFGAQEQDAVYSIMDTVVSTLRDDDEGIKILSLICLGSMTKCLTGRIIPILPKVVPYALEMLEASLKGSWQLHNAVYTLLDELVKAIPNFMTSYLEKILKLSSASAGREESLVTLDGEDEVQELEEAEEEARRMAMIMRNDVLSGIAKMDFKKVLTCLLSTWSTATENGVLATQEALSTLNQLLGNMSKSAVVQSQSIFSKIFLQVFDLRKTSGFGLEDIKKLEEQCFKVVVQMVFKLNDTAFRPMFSRFLQWASDDQGLLRMRTFYGFLDVLIESLSSIITTYYGIVLDNTVQLLEQLRTSTKDQDLDLWQLVIKTLVNSFVNDQDEFWLSPTQFDRIYPALLSQLTNSAILPVEQTVIPAIVELTVAAQSEENFKKINTAMLKHMRSDSAATRLSAVRLATELYSRLGEEWLAMLPETLPTISELMEDDDEQVERATQRLIVKIEEYLGESMDSMLT